MRGSERMNEWYQAGGRERDESKEMSEMKRRRRTDKESNLE